jgi:hypothetical protein
MPRKIKLGVKQRAILALVIEQGGTLVVGNVKMLGVKWATEHGNINRAIEGLIHRGYLTCGDEHTTTQSVIYATPEGRKLIKDPVKAVAECVTHYTTGLFDAASIRMMVDVEAALSAGRKVCVVVENLARRADVRRATRHKLGHTTLLVLTPLDAKIDWLTLTVPGGYEAFVEPALLERKMEKPLAYLEKYRS